MNKKQKVLLRETQLDNEEWCFLTYKVNREWDVVFALIKLDQSQDGMEGNRFKQYSVFNTLFILK